MMLVAQSDQQSSAQALHDQLTAQLKKEDMAYRQASAALRNSEAYKKARADKDSKKLRELRSGLKMPDRPAYAKRAMEAAAKFDGEGAVKLLGWAAINGRDPKIVRDVVAKIEAYHMKTEGLIDLLEKGRVLSRPLGKEGADAFLTKVIDQSPHDVAKAWAYYWKSVAYTGRGASEEMRAKGAELSAQAEKLAGDHWLGDKIRGPKFKAEKLQTGLVAPNIVGEDIDGVKFELEDYRGKVVVLDFWGFW